MGEHERSSHRFTLTYHSRELLKTLGVPLVVDDLYSLEAEALAELQPLHALIFLFKWVGGESSEPSSGGQYDPEFPGFFAHQVVNNACATLAVMNAIGNIWLASTPASYWSW